MRARSLNLPPRWTLVTVPSSRVPEGIAVFFVHRDVARHARRHAIFDLRGFRRHRRIQTNTDHRVGRHCQFVELTLRRRGRRRHRHVDRRRGRAHRFRTRRPRGRRLARRGIRRRGCRRGRGSRRARRVRAGWSWVDLGRNRFATRRRRAFLHAPIGRRSLPGRVGPALERELARRVQQAPVRRPQTCRPAQRRWTLAEALSRARGRRRSAASRGTHQRPWLPRTPRRPPK
jgi:hypothetical protein